MKWKVFFCFVLIVMAIPSVNCLQAIDRNLFFPAFGTPESTTKYCPDGTKFYHGRCRKIFSSHSTRYGKKIIMYYRHFVRFSFLCYSKSIAVAQVVACVPVTQLAGLDPRSVKVSWVRFFRGFSSPVRQMSGNFRPIWFPEYHLAIIIIIFIFALLE